MTCQTDFPGGSEITILENGQLTLMGTLPTGVSLAVIRHLWWELIRLNPGQCTSVQVNLRPVDEVPGPLTPGSLKLFPDCGSTSQ